MDQWDEKARVGLYKATMSAPGCDEKLVGSYLTVDEAKAACAEALIDFWVDCPEAELVGDQLLGELDQSWTDHGPGQQVVGSAEGVAFRIETV